MPGAPVALAVRALPDYIIWDMANLLQFTARIAPSTVQDMPGLTKLARALVTLIGSKAVIKNPHLRGELVEGAQSCLCSDFRTWTRLQMGRSPNLLSGPNLVEITISRKLCAVDLPDLLHVLRGG